ncbi:MAG: three-Cys-motif partner protein TcmP, partial [Chloroflexota bacterium]|nr:three-Cys-motif partner protein TcmP [Chloroflexota bacterium]
MSNAPTFGGAWTSEKLEILRRYLDAYTTALKNQGFSLTYVDGFAGAGVYTESSRDYQEFQELHEGSATIALRIEDRLFDRLLFIEKDGQRVSQLRRLAEESPRRAIDVVQGDANDEVQKFCHEMQSYDRAVVFLDPFATEVSWSTVEAIAATEKIDCWILFPLMAVTRMMPTDEEPDERLKDHLDRIFGGRQFWEGEYRDSPQLSFLDIGPQRERTSGTKRIADAYRIR